MNRRFHRRRFLAGALAASVAAVRGRGLGEGPPQARKILDIHVHLFGTGDAGSGCRLSKATTDGPLFKFHRRKYCGSAKRAKTLDKGYALALAEQVEKSGLDKAVILAQDAVYDRAASPTGTRPISTSPTIICSRWWPATRAMSPALDQPRSRRCHRRTGALAAKGARVLKIHPPTQGVDLAEKKHGAFFRRCADVKMIVMVHTGHEHTHRSTISGLPTRKNWSWRWTRAARSWPATAAPAGRPPARHAAGFLAMVRKYKNLWGDTAVLGSPGRARDFQRLLADPKAKDGCSTAATFPFRQFRSALRASSG